MITLQTEPNEPIKIINKADGTPIHYFYCPHTMTNHPGTKNPKLAVDFVNDLFFCWVCHFRGRASDLFKKVMLKGL